ncbi:hypothetical protein NE237_017927 [Protea cynaroides]|uniref:Serine-tRNA synthetase type1 N-terminal domain-containing protein n=1 Tax=Protea cynaroides TaxID=273540 RepID=A0A9Q0K8Y8_9MAGN|nr:hypothetical protein NE237_017927 [Protea cynaroides]
MLDINLFRENKGFNPERIRESRRRRFASLEIVDEIIRYDEEWRKLNMSSSSCSCPSTITTIELPTLKLWAGEDAAEMIKNTKAKKQLIAEKEDEVQEVRAALISRLEMVGNLVHDSVPIGDDKPIMCCDMIRRFQAAKAASISSVTDGGRSIRSASSSAFQHSWLSVCRRLVIQIYAFLKMSYVLHSGSFNYNFV